MSEVSVSTTGTTVEVDIANRLEIIAEPLQQSVEVEIEHTPCCHLTFSQIVQVATFIGSSIFSIISITVNSIYGRF